MAASNASPFSLRPWPTTDKKPKNLAEFIARVNSEQNGFRNVTEAKLREEVKAEEEGRATTKSADGSSDTEDEADGDRPKPVAAAREEFLKNVESAHQSAMLSLDYVSLLLSKETPVQGGMTLSPALRDLVGIGTLGASKLKESNITEARMKDDLAVATGWRVMGINQMVDSVMAAAERLEKEMSLEARYWADVLAVSENDWAVCPFPQEPHTLGVRFGFAEATPEFRNQSIAPLRRNDDGSVRLDIGRVGGGSQRVRVTIQKNGSITGASLLPKRPPADAPLQDRVLEARNTIFSQELWHEINREARTLLALGVQSENSTVTYDMGQDERTILTLEDLDDTGGAPDDLPDNRLANTIAISLHFNLFYTHRQNFLRRTHPSQPPSNRTSTNPPYSILRPLITKARYNKSFDSVVYFVEDLIYVLAKAGVTSVTYSASMHPISTSSQQAAQSRRNSKSELLTNNLIYAFSSLLKLSLTPDVHIHVHNRGFLTPFVGQKFIIQLPPVTASTTSSSTTNPDQQQQQQQSTTPNPLELSYPPANDNYPDTDSVISYLLQASVRVLTAHFANVAAQNLEGKANDIDWNEGRNGPVITDREDKEVMLDIVPQGPGGNLALTLTAHWLDLTSITKADSDRRTGDSNDEDLLSTVKTRTWTWSAAEGSSEERLEAVLFKVFRGDLTQETA